MEVKNPRRILAVSLDDAVSTSHLSRVLKDLTGTHPVPATIPADSPVSGPSPAPAPAATAIEAGSESLAGTTHLLPLKTQYYTADIPVWLDLVSAPAEWATSFLAPEAKEVLDALGGVVVVFGMADGIATQARELVSNVGRVVREGLGGWEWDGVLLAVGVGDLPLGEEGEGVLDGWEDICAEWGLEFVHVRGGGGGSDGERNEFGERMGIARAMEALQANNWVGLEGDEEDEGFGEFRQAEGDEGEFDPESMDFGFDREDFVGLKKAIWDAAASRGADGNMDLDGEGSGKEKGVDMNGQTGEDDEDLGDEEVRKLERMMLKLQAVRDMSAGLPDEQRKRMAQQAVGEVMKEL